jgi:surface protein
VRRVLEILAYLSQGRMLPIAVRALGLVLISLSLLLTAPHESAAQANLIGTSVDSGELVGYAITQNGTTVTVESVGQIVPTGKIGHLFGRFVGGREKDLVKVRKIRGDTFAFMTTSKRGSNVVRRVRLSRKIGSLYYLLTGFDINSDGSDDVAIVDVSEHRYRWSIIENPMRSSARELQSFYLGFTGDRVEWSLSPNRDVEFAAVRQTINTSRTRALLRNSVTGDTRTFRSRWQQPSGLLIPLRLKEGFRYDPGIALYSPAKRAILMFDSEGSFVSYELPKQRCGGFQAVTNVDSRGAVSAIEVCGDGSYIVAQRAEGTTGDEGDSIIASGALPEPISNLRRGDLTVIRDQIGEVAVPIVAPGSDGSAVLDPVSSAPATGVAPTPTSQPQATPTATSTPEDTAAETPSPTPTATPIPIPFVFTIDTTQTSTGSTSANQFKLPLLPGGAYNFRVSWGDGTESIVTSYDDVDATHTYSSSGEYTVSVYGQLHGFRFDNTGDRLKLLDISQWGNGFRFANTSAMATKYPLSASEEKIEVLLAHAGFIWAGTDTTPAKIIKFDPTNVSYSVTTLESDEGRVYAMATDGAYIYATDWDASSRIIKIDPTTGARLAGYETGVSSLFAMTFDGEYIWAGSNSGSPKLVRFNPTDTSIVVYDLNGTDGSWSVVSVGNFIFGVNGSKLYRFNKTSSAVDTVAITGAASVEGLAYDGVSLWASTEETPAKLLKFNTQTLSYEIFAMPTTANSSEGMIYDGEYLWATIKNAEVASLLKIPPNDPGSATIVPLSTDFAKVNALAVSGSTIWGGELGSPAALYKISKAAWPSDSFFYGCANMTVSAADTPDMTGVTSMRNSFRDCTSFNSDIGNWDVSASTDFSGAFQAAESFNNGGAPLITLYEPGPFGGVAAGSKLYVSSGIVDGVRYPALSQGAFNFVSFYHGQSTISGVRSQSGKILLGYNADFPNLTRVRLSTTGALPGGLVAGTDYWVIRQQYYSDSVRSPAGLLATSLANAENGIAISYSSVGSGTHTITSAEDVGWAQSSPHTQYWTKAYDDGTTMLRIPTGSWANVWFYRNRNPADRAIYYVAGNGSYANRQGALDEIERADLPEFLSSNCFLLGKVARKLSGFEDFKDYDDNIIIEPPVPQRSVALTGSYPGSDSIKNWVVGGGRSFRAIFAGAVAFNRALLWDVSNSRSFNSAFSSALSFNQNLRFWDVRNSSDFSLMFYNAISFNNGDDDNIATAPIVWNTTNGINFASMFNSAYAFNQNVASWDMRNAEAIDSMFNRARIFNNGDITDAATKPLSWDLPKVKTATYVFSEQNPFNQDIGSWFSPQGSDVMQVQNLYQGICTRRPSSFNKIYNNGGSPNINNWRIPNATNLALLFSRCAFFNQPVGDWVVSAATSMDSMFYYATAFNRDVSSWDTSDVTNMASMFMGASSFNNGDAGDNSANPLTWNVGNVTSFSGMFSSATSFNQDISTWNVSAATTMASMFSGASKFNSFLGAWNPASVTTFSALFQNAAAFNNGDPVGVSTKSLAWSNTAAVITMASMFSGARRFNQSLSAFNTSNVTSLASTFASANSFNQDITGWDVSKVTSFNGTFNGASSFRRDLTAWTPTAGTDFANMFASTDINSPGTSDNYDNLLLRLATVTTQNSRSLSGGSARYSYTGLGDATAGTGRAHLTAATSASPTPGHAWTIADGGTANCTFSSSSGLLVTYTGDRPTYSQIVFKTSGTLPTGISAGTTYWTVRVSATTARLATSLASAQSNTVIAYTDSGSGTHALMNLGHVFTASNSSGTLLLTLTTGGELNFSGRKARFTSTSTLPTGITAGVDYWLNRVSATTYRVTSNVVDANLGTNTVAFTDSGSGTHELILQ